MIKKRISNWIRAFALVGMLLWVAGTTQAAGLGTILRASIASSGGQANNHSKYAVVSANGKVVAFQSYATNLVEGDLSTAQDIFLHGFETEQTHWISVSDSGVGANAHSYHPSISADGRYTAFETQATNFVPETNGFFHIYVRDRELNDTELISVSTIDTPGNGNSRNASISEDGRYVAFESTASNLVEGDNNNKIDIFVRDRVAGTTEQIIVTDPYWGAGDCLTPAISENGRFVTFVFDRGYPNNTALFLYDRTDETMDMIAVNGDEEWANGNSYNPSISADGRFVAFETTATNFSPGDTAELMDIYVRDTVMGTTERVTISTNGENPNNNSWYPAISADGQLIVFISKASNLVADTTDNSARVYRHDMVTHITELIAPVTGGGAGIEDRPTISSSGREVAFSSYLSDLVEGDTNGFWDVFIYQEPKPNYSVFLPILVR